MRRSRRTTTWGIFPLAGWLFTDLLLALTLLFLVTSVTGVAKPLPSPKVTPTPVICGVDPKYESAIVTSRDPDGVRNQTPDAMNSFFADVQHSDLQKYQGRLVGVAEVFGGSPDVGDGITFAAGAIKSLSAHSNGSFLFYSRTVFFRPLWDGELESDQVRIYVFFLTVAATSCAS